MRRTSPWGIGSARARSGAARTTDSSPSISSTLYRYTVHYKRARSITQGSVTISIASTERPQSGRDLWRSRIDGDDARSLGSSWPALNFEGAWDLDLQSASDCIHCLRDVQHKEFELNVVRIPEHEHSTVRVITNRGVLDSIRLEVLGPRLELRSGLYGE